MNIEHRLNFDRCSLLAHGKHSFQISGAYSIAIFSWTVLLFLLVTKWWVTFILSITDECLRHEPTPLLIPIWTGIVSWKEVIKASNTKHLSVTTTCNSCDLTETQGYSFLQGYPGILVERCSRSVPPKVWPADAKNGRNLWSPPGKIHAKTRHHREHARKSLILRDRLAKRHNTKVAKASQGCPGSTS